MHTYCSCNFGNDAMDPLNNSVHYEHTTVKQNKLGIKRTRLICPQRPPYSKKPDIEKNNHHD